MPRAGRAVFVEPGRALVEAAHRVGTLEHDAGRGLDAAAAEQLGHSRQVAGVDALGVGVDEVLDDSGVVGLTGVVRHARGW